MIFKRFNLMLLMATLAIAASGCASDHRLGPLHISWKDTEAADSSDHDSDRSEASGSQSDPSTDDAAPEATPSTSDPDQGADSPRSNGTSISEDERLRMLRGQLGQMPDAEARRWAGEPPEQPQDQWPDPNRYAVDPSQRPEPTPTAPMQVPQAPYAQSTMPLGTMAQAPVPPASTAPGPAPAPLQNDHPFVESIPSPSQGLTQPALPDANSPEQGRVTQVPLPPLQQGPSEANVAFDPNVRGASHAEPVPSAPDSSHQGNANDSATVLSEDSQQDWSAKLTQALQEMERTLAANRETMSQADRERMEVHMRLIALALGEQEKAISTIEALDPHLQEYWKQQLFALHTLIKTDDIDFGSNYRFDDPRQLMLALDYLRQAETELASQATLRVHRVVFCDEVKSYGNFHEFDDTTFTSNQPFIVYCEVENFLSEQVADSEEGISMYETEFEASLVIFNSKKENVEQISYDTIVDRARHPRRDMYLHFTVTVPDDLPPGKYYLGVVLEDLKANKKSNAQPIEFEIR